MTANAVGLFGDGRDPLRLAEGVRPVQSAELVSFVAATVELSIFMIYV
jgi:hypothetical protein